MSDINKQDIFIPCKLNSELRKQLPQNLDSSVRAQARSLQEQDWRIFVVGQSCGRCYYDSKVITIPSWIFNRSRVLVTLEAKNLISIDKLPDNFMMLYKQWYLCHEMAHALAAGKHKEYQHGEAFMHELKRICPVDSLHFELGYKPKNAQKAGIMLPMELV